MSTVYLVGRRPTLRLPLGAAIPAPWDSNVHPFSERCAPPIGTLASYSLSYVGNSGSSTDLHISAHIALSIAR
ncbi:jg4569 [Pararge aegeria aegeria]|uniref:Jg4569 protein n=1 Tax=Pararge aegeria aegeria TaxID=348720 RepID=A0A8S4RQX2_9NEOP|nr:jg4569 [Pararge aegeria aegeria]